MKETLEHEVKLSVGPDFTLPPLPVETTPRHLRATYYDTEDLRLARYGVTLRRRDEDGRDLWQLKLRSGGDRLELEQPADGPVVPADFTRLVTAYARGAELRPVAELHTLRRALRVTENGKPWPRSSTTRWTCTTETASSARSPRSRSSRSPTAPSDLVERLAKQLRAVGARAATTAPSCSRRSTCRRAAGRAVKRGAPAIEHLRAYLEAQTDALLEHDPAARRDDPEGVHGMRVATRRMRSALKEAGRLLDPGWVQRDAERAEVARRPARRGA